MVTTGSPLRVAVVGAGPAGWFTAHRLLSEAAPELRVDMFDRMPAPGGLARFGVAPDRRAPSLSPEFDATRRHPRFRFFGNVTIGADVSWGELQRGYHAVVFATGAPSARVLGIPGEELAGSVSAAALAGWYNGHPDHRSLDPPLDAPRAIVVGHGNVALDAARMLVLGEAALRATDVAPQALQRLAASRVREVVVAGRRGPAQAAFTASELLSLEELDDVEVVVDAAELAQALRVEDHEAAADLRVRRNLKVLRRLAERRETGAGRRVVIRFLLAPQEILGRRRVTAVTFVHNELAPDSDGSLRVRATALRGRIPAGLVVRAIGHRGVRLGDLPFDEQAGVVPNDRGRVLGPGGPLPGHYVVGWLKRGPSGVIAANEQDATETVAALLDDLAERHARQWRVPDLFENNEQDIGCSERW